MLPGLVEGPGRFGGDILPPLKLALAAPTVLVALPEGWEAGTWIAPGFA